MISFGLAEASNSDFSPYPLKADCSYYAVPCALSMSFCRPTVSNAPSERADSVLYVGEKKPDSAALQRPPSPSMLSLPGNLTSLCVRKYVYFVWVRAQRYRETPAHAYTRASEYSYFVCESFNLMTCCLYWQVQSLTWKIKAVTISVPASSQCFAFLSQLWFGRTLWCEW